MLYFIPTPIGNLGDITHRALEVLAQVQLILAEDTRTTGRLLKHYGISTKLRSYHIHNEHKIVDELVEMARETDIALVTDAGTPGISDPGFLLSRACVQAQVDMNCLPGPTAFVSALVVSGLPMDKFHFEGFLPTKKGRQTRLIWLSALPHTFILYESPHRIVRCLRELSEHCGPERLASLSRELTKLHEENIHGTLKEISEILAAKPSIKGEIVLCVQGKIKT